MHEPHVHRPSSKPEGTGRQRIVEAAARIVARHGVAGARVDDIAREAGYSAGALYRYFQGKDELLRAVLREVGRRFLGVFQESAEFPEPFPAYLRTLLVRQFELARTHRDLFVAFLGSRLFADPAGASGPAFETALLYRQYLASVERIMEQGIARGALRPGSARHYADAFVGIARGFFNRWLVEGACGDLVAFADVIVDLFMHGAGAGSRS